MGIKREINSGDKFYQLTVIEPSDTLISNNGRKVETFLCRCDCGNVKVVKKPYLLSGDVKSCGCRQRNLHPKKINEMICIGDRFGKLEVVNYLPEKLSKSNKRRTYRMVLCRCDCGNIKEVSLYSLVSGATKSCGCIRKQVASEKMRKHNTYEINGEVTKVFDENGNFALIDTEDLEKVKPYYFSKSKKDAYWTRVEAPKPMHRFITDCPNGMVVDHINHDRSDNRRCNLKVCTQGDNRKNQPFIGIVFLEHIGKWQASIKTPNGIKYLGVFNTFDSAVDTYRGWFN